MHLSALNKICEDDIKMKMWRKILIPVTISAFVLSGCYGGDSEKGTSTGDTKDKDDSSNAETLHLATTGEIPTLKTNGEMDGQSETAIQNIFEGLYRKDENDKPTEGVAEDYEKDGNTYTFYLREDAVWSNGDSVTADDFVYSWKKALHPDTLSPHSELMDPIKNAAEIKDSDDDMYGDVDELGVKAIDDLTLEVTLDYDVPYFFELLTNPVYYPQNEEFVNEEGDDYALEADNLVFNGPYKMTKWDHDQEWILEKNDDYWDEETVKTEKIDVRVVKDTATEVNLYESDTIDVANISSEFVDEYEDDDDFVTSLQTEMYFLRMNQKNEDLQNNNIRHALDMAYDKEKMVDRILKNGSVGAHYLIPPDSPEFESPSGEDFRDKNGDMNKGNIEKAQQLFEKGMKELGKDEIKLELLSYEDDQRKSVAEYIQNQWETNLSGLDVKINEQPNKQKLSLEGDLNYDISYSGWRADIPDPIDFLRIYLSDGPYNWQDFKNEKYDELINKAQKDFSDKKKRFADMQEAEKILIKDEAAISPMYVSGVAQLMEPYVDGLVTHSDNTSSYKWVEMDK